MPCDICFKSEYWNKIFCLTSNLILAFPFLSLGAELTNPIFMPSRLDEYCPKNSVQRLPGYLVHTYTHKHAYILLLHTHTDCHIFLRKFGWVGMFYGIVRIFFWYVSHTFPWASRYFVGFPSSNSTTNFYYFPGK